MEGVVERLKPLLQRSEEDPRPVVVMTCGLCGSGKTTLSKAILEWNPDFERLSIDKFIYEKHGLYNIDYPPDKISEYQDEADAEVDSRLKTLLQTGEKDIIVDLSFYSRADRQQRIGLIEKTGARYVLIYLKAPSKEFLWDRICSRRSKGVNADSAYEITLEILDGYWQGFEAPSGEQEIVIDIERL